MGVHLGLTVEDTKLLTELEVSRSWRKLFSRPELSEDLFTKAEALIDELRPESPLRHRLGMELEELRQRADVSDTV
ncbi:MAG TPA: hypothetical protein VMV10_12485 [Pirellulales bacterium]|nr:hypothetical protein [Pirellulales bacterium]